MGNGNTITNDTTNAFIFGDNNSIQLDLTNTGSTATTLSNIFLLGNNLVASTGNTLYTNNIQMSSGSTFNGVPVSGVTNPTLSNVLTNGDTMLTTQKIASYAGLASIELDKVGTEGVYALSLDGLGGYSKLNLNKSTDATFELTDNGVNISNIVLSPVNIDISVTDGTDTSTIDITPPLIDILTTNATNTTQQTFSSNIELNVTDGTNTNFTQFNIGDTSLSVTDGTDTSTITINAQTITISPSINLSITSIPAFADDAAAGTAGLLINDVYQTDGTGAAPLNVAGIMMIKQ
jgi:hypothetical protein